MPLLRRQPFKKEPVPPNLRPEEELFFCKLTKEVFRDYDAFFERVILCNSLVWTCELSGRPGLTYQEAIESEARARDTLRAIPISMRKPLLYLAYISRCGRLSDLCDEVFLYAKDRFFVGEEVDALINGQRAPCKIVKVVPPGNNSKRKQSFTKLMTSENSDDEDAADAALQYDPSKCQYMVLDCKSSDREIHLLAPEDILRKKGVFSRERSKLFLKQTCHLSGCQWAVKDKFVEKYGIGRMKFRDIFAGARPSFESEPSRKRGIVPLPSQQAAIAAANSKAKSGKDAAQTKKGASSKTTAAGGGKAAANGGSKGNGKGAAGDKKMSAIVRKQIEADEEATRQAEALAAFEERRRAKEELRLKIEEDRRRRKEEKEREREQQKEERRIMAECLKEWQKPRDDLECDDLVDMPTPVPVLCGIPNETFGDAALLLEFVHSFSETLETRDRFPQGLTLELLERALVDRDVQGPLNDLLQLLLRAAFRFQEEDDEDDGNGGAGTAGCSDGAVTAALGQQTEDLDVKRAQQVAAAAANWPVYCHGASLRKLTLDAFNLTEVLRLHLLSSGARKNPEDPTSADDPGFSLWLQEPELVRTLAHTNVFDLSANQKLKLLCTLVNQLLGFYNLREEVDENLEKARLARNDLRSMQWAEQRREREEASLRFKKKMEERATVRETETDKKDAKPAKSEKAKKVPTAEELRHEEEKQAEREARRKQDFLRKEKEIAESVAHFQGRGALLPIGRDRAYRRFWMFANLPGLFVEDDDRELGPCPPEPTPYNPNSNPYASFNSSVSQARSQQLNGVVGDKENDAIKGAAAAVNGVAVSLLKKNHKLLSDNHPTTGAVVKSEPVDGAADVLIKIEDGAAEESGAGAGGKPTIFGMCNALGDACPVHGVKPAGTCWSFFPSTVQVEALIAALNPRGFREGSLKEILVADKRRVLQSVGRCPVSRLNPSVRLDGAVGEEAGSGGDGVVRKSNRFSQPTQAVYPANTTMEDFLELTLRDSIVDIEDKIHAGGLGSIKVIDRSAWREAIMQHSYDRQCENLRWGVKLENRKLVLGESGNNLPSTAANPKPCRVGSPVPTKSVVTDLSSALLQIFQGIELKYLTPPLAGDKDGASHKSASERWEEALMSCTSLSQVFLFLTTLEKSVAWSRSALNARCRICRRRGDAEHMLLCDECDRGHHMYCLKPRLKNVPEGDWLCPDCKPVEKPKKSRKRRPTQEEVEEEEEEMDEDEDINVSKIDTAESSSDEAEPPAKKKRDDSKKEPARSSKREPATRDGTPKPETPQLDIPCALCKKEGELVVCCGCQLGYHAECADPPFRRSSRGRWRCLMCGGTAAAAPTSAAAAIDGGDSDAGTTSRTGGRDRGSDRHSGRSRQAPQNNRAPQTIALKSKGAANDDQIRRSARNMGRDIDYKRHSKYESDEDWETSTPRRSSRRPREDLSDDEYYGMTKRQMRPNRRGASGDVPLDYKICDQLLTEMVRHEDSWHFLRPIGKKELPLYHRVIKCPMDFGTMRSKLNTMTYTDNKQFVTDVFLVFQNCCVFNPANSLQYRAAETLGRLFHRRLRELELPLLTQEEREAMRELPTPTKAATRKRVLPLDWEDSDSNAEATDESGYDESGSEAMSERASEELVQQNGEDGPEIDEEEGDDDDEKQSEGEEEEVIVELEDEVAESGDDSAEDGDDDNERGNGAGRLVIDCRGGDEANDNRSNSSLSQEEQ